MPRIARYTEEEFAKLRASADVVAVTLAEVARVIAPGVPLSHLDRVAEQCIRDHHAVPACKGYMGYPATLCLSVNEVVVHGIPSPSRYLRDGVNLTDEEGVFFAWEIGRASCRERV